MSDKLQLVVKAGNTDLAQNEIPAFLHPLEVASRTTEVASYQPRRQAEACRTFRNVRQASACRQGWEYLPCLNRDTDVLASFSHKVTADQSARDTRLTR